jgi:hypothetical protein
VHSLRKLHVVRGLYKKYDDTAQAHLLFSSDSMSLLVHVGSSNTFTTFAHGSVSTVCMNWS